MEFDIIDKTDQGWFVVRTTGHMTLKNVTEMFQAMLTHPSWFKGVGLIMDHSKVFAADLSVDDMIEMGELMIILDNKYRPGPCAMIVPSQMGSFLSNMVKIVVDRKVGFAMKIFKHDQFGEAEKWIKNNVELN